ncbi:TetR/AcrR family transcriptional regulator [Geomicrobium sp. JCM 19038]|uniref:TetR/AcrR family transcriptional regulator n=1 Tax=Geomicrobium sp. JCM 19038 TaxID=1460635 RepID=UPI00045F3E53|nr:TetR-like C-terminal domain-containing protein [Geomicrobium sp. JCM 19038]GAK08015.1 transcriptional regulator, TetR family [Geomicrobium sp. JCM 19038]
MNNKTDRRVERTKRDIRLAFIELIEKHEAKDITIQEVTDLANYNRTTFYAHYSDQKGLIEDIIDDAIQGFIDVIQPSFHNGKVPNSIKFSPSASKMIFRYIEQNKSMFNLLFNVNKFPSFQEKLCFALKDLLLDDLHFVHHYKNHTDRSLYCYTQAAALVGRINFWIKEGYTVDADYMAEQMVSYLRLFK